MTAHQYARRILDNRFYLECPRWRGDSLFVVDMYADEVLSVNLDGSSEVVATVAGQPGGLGWLPDGQMLIVSMEKRKILRRKRNGELATYADLSDRTSWDLNDMAVDSRGNAYVGGFGFALHSYDPIANAPLFHIATDGTITEYGDGLRTPNGIAILPGERTLVVAETFGSRLTAFDIGEDGILSNQRVWADFDGPETDDILEYVSFGAITPDGLCADSDGSVWMADVIGQRCVRVCEGGSIIDEVKHDMLVIAPALGGPSGRTLFLCTAPTFDREQRRAARESELVAVEV